jgi:hypothetical protein
MGSVCVVQRETLNHWPFAASHLHRLRTHFHLQAPEIIFPHCAVLAFVGVDTGDHLHPVPFCCLCNKHIK